MSAHKSDIMLDTRMVILSTSASSGWGKRKGHWTLTVILEKQWVLSVQPLCEHKAQCPEGPALVLTAWYCCLESPGVFMSDSDWYLQPIGVSEMCVSTAGKPAAIPSCPIR